MTFQKYIPEVLCRIAMSLIKFSCEIIKIFIPLKYIMKDITGELALVTGGGSRLGRSIALELSNHGAIIVIWDINENGIKETMKLIQETGGTCYGYVCDLVNREEVYEKAAKLREEVGHVTILINNAGMTNVKKFVNIPDNLLTRIMEVNTISHFWTVKAFLPAMIENNKGHIVCISSYTAWGGVPMLVDYCTSKHAVRGFYEALDTELHCMECKIKITVISPGFISNTGMKTEEHLKSSTFMTSPEKVAKKTVIALRCNRKNIIIPGYYNVILIFKCTLAIPQKKTVKYLGVTLDHLLRLNKHHSIQLNKAKIAIKANSRIFYNSNLEARAKIICYQLLIRPLLTYAAPVLWNMGSTVMEKYRRLERSVFRFCIRTHRTAESDYKKYVSNTKIYNLANITRVDCFIIKLFRNNYANYPKINNPIINKFCCPDEDDFAAICNSGYIPPELFTLCDKHGLIQNENNLTFLYHIKRHCTDKTINMEPDTTTRKGNLPKLLARANMPKFLATAKMLRLFAKSNMLKLLAKANLPKLLAKVNMPKLLAKVNIIKLLAKVNMPKLLEKVNLIKLLEKVNLIKLLAKSNMLKLLENADMPRL
ncbi:hypothetical protein M0802_013093 [Mischocyttarus mexicanus]|nr:hypothetical protein M0802_013093 [Mischocyttarus mexicanus]